MIKSLKYFSVGNYEFEQRSRNTNNLFYQLLQNLLYGDQKLCKA